MISEFIVEAVTCVLVNILYIHITCSVRHISPLTKLTPGFHYLPAFCGFVIGLFHLTCLSVSNADVIEGAVYDSGESLLVFELNNQTNTPLLPSALLRPVHELWKRG